MDLDRSQSYVCLDWGREEWQGWFFGEHQRRIDVSRGDFLGLDWLPRGCHQIVIERAHIQVPRNGYSLAQVYPQNEIDGLVDYARERGVKIFVFPHNMTGRYRARAGLLGNDIRKQWGDDWKDARAMAEFLHVMPVHLSELHKIRDRDRAARRHVYEFRRMTNEILNSARACRDASDRAYQTNCLCWSLLDRAKIRVRAKDDVLRTSLGTLLFSFRPNSLLGGIEDNRGQQWEIYEMTREQYERRCDLITSMGITALYTLASLVVTPDGQQRRHPGTDKPPGVGWLMRQQIGTSPNHHRGGVARSNLYFWWMKSQLRVPNKEGRKFKFGDQEKAPRDLPIWALSLEQLEELRQKRRDAMWVLRFLLFLLQDAEQEGPLEYRKVFGQPKQRELF